MYEIQLLKVVKAPKSKALEKRQKRMDKIEKIIQSGSNKDLQLKFLAQKEQQIERKASKPKRIMAEKTT